MPRVEVAVDMPAPMVRRITLDRPEILNAINDTMRAQLHEEVARALSDKRVRVIILDGAGANFSAGGDIRFMQTLDRDALIAFHGRLLDLCRLIGSAEKPVVAAVRGVCAGGALGIALACDQLVATASTHFLIPFLRIGLTPDMILPYWLARRTGPQVARNIILQGEPVQADRALALGLCDRVCEEGELERVSLAAANHLAGLAPKALTQTRRLLAHSSAPFDEYLELERAAVGVCLGGPEFREGVAAFFEKRPPVWPQSEGDE